MTGGSDDDGQSRPGLATVLAEWGRIGITGFGGPPTHIKLLRELCVQRRRWIGPAEFEDAIAACNLLPGPASTQLAIYCAWRVRARSGAVVGGLAFILPGLIAILVLSALFLAGSPPDWVLGAGAGAGAAVAAVALHAGWQLAGPSWGKARRRGMWAGYVAAGALAAALLGAWVVLVLLACGALALALDGAAPPPSAGAARAVGALPALALASLGGSSLLTLSWVALKVGALSYGGGFVIIPLMQADAVDHYGWMTGDQFLNAVALGQVTPGPVLHTVAAVGYAAGGLPGALLAAAIAFSPSFAFVLAGAHRFDRLRADTRIRAFLDGAGPAAIGAILGTVVPLARALTQPWQFAVLLAAGAALLTARLGVVAVLIAAGLVGAAVALGGGAVPGA